MRTDEHGLNDRQRKFASLIVKGATATEAYKQSFPRCKSILTAEVHGCELLKNSQVSAYITFLRAQDNERLAMDRIITKQELLEFLTGVVKTPAGDIDKHHELCQSYKDKPDEKEIKLPDKLRAAERICKMLGWDAPEKIEDVTPKQESETDIKEQLNNLARWINLAPKVEGETIES